MQYNIHMNNKDEKDMPSVKLADIIIKNTQLALVTKFGAESELVKGEWPECLGLIVINLMALDDRRVLDYFNNSVFSRFFGAFAPELLPYILEKSVEEYSIQCELEVNSDGEKKNDKADAPGDNR